MNNPPSPDQTISKRSRRWRNLGFAVLVFCVFQCGSCSGNLINGMSHGQVLLHSNQPSNIHYRSFDPYELRIQEGPAKYDSIFLLSDDRYLIIDIARKSSNFAYFHRVTFDALGSREPSSVVWSQEGISLSYPKGHKLFIPKGSFIGGR